MSSFPYNYIVYRAEDGQVLTTGNAFAPDLSAIPQPPETSLKLLVVDTLPAAPWRCLVIDGVVHENTLAEYVPWPPR